jgi:hypothetical protein
LDSFKTIKSFSMSSIYIIIMHILLGFEDDTPGAMIHSLAETYLGDAKNSDNFTDHIPGLLDVRLLVP